MRWRYKDRSFSKIKRLTIGRHLEIWRFEGKRAVRTGKCVTSLQVSLISKVLEVLQDRQTFQWTFRRFLVFFNLEQIILPTIQLFVELIDFSLSLSLSRGMPVVCVILAAEGFECKLWFLL